MASKSTLSKTMRIDLIPDVPTDPVASRKERVVITTPSRTRRRPPGMSEPGEVSQYQALLQSLYDAAIIVDMRGRIVDVNVRAVEFLLFGRDELLGMSVWDVVSGADESLIGTVIKNLEGDSR